MLSNLALNWTNQFDRDDHWTMTQTTNGQRHLLLDPRFLIQLATLLVIGVSLYYGLVNNQDALAKNQEALYKEQARQSQSLERIENRLPNNEATELRLKGMQDDIAELRSKIDEFDDWVRITSQQIAVDRASRSRDGG